MPAQSGPSRQLLVKQLGSTTSPRHLPPTPSQLSRLESGPLFQPHQFPPDACACQRILGQPGRVAAATSLAQRKPSHPPRQPDRMRHNSDGRSPRVSRPSALQPSSEPSRTATPDVDRVARLPLRKIGVGNEPLGSVGETQFDAIFQDTVIMRLSARIIVPLALSRPKRIPLQSPNLSPKLSP